MTGVRSAAMPHLARAVLPLDLGGTAARAQAFFQTFQLFDKTPHVRDAGNFGCGIGDGVHVM